MAEDELHELARRVAALPPEPDRYDYSGLPPGLRDGMRRYLQEHIPSGGFLNSVLENDFRGAVCRADHANYHAMREISQWLSTFVPSTLHGSREAVVRHLGGRLLYLQGRLRQAELLEQVADAERAFGDEP